MSLETICALMRTYMPGRRARLKDEAAALRRDKVPEGVSEGLILKLVPLPDVGLGPAVSTFGVELEIETKPGEYDTLVVATDDVEPHPLSLDQIRMDLIGREVNFPRSSGIGIDFRAGSDDYAVIEHALFRPSGIGSQFDLVVIVRVAVDPGKNPDGIDSFYTEADFIQCVLVARKPSP